MDVGGAPPARHDADVEFHLAVGRGRAGDGEGAAADVTGQDQVNVLPGLEAHAGIELDPHPLDGRGKAFDACHHAVKIPHRQVLGVRVLVDLGLDDQIALGGGTAGQALLLVPLEIHEGKAGSLAMLHLAVRHLNLAGGAQAMAAGMGQVDTGAQGRVEDGLPLFDFDGLAEGLNGQRIAHRPVLRRRPTGC